jgi:hypothetical protein
MAKFQKGISGNPDGRPKGISDKRTELGKLLIPHAEKLVAKAVDLALKGDPQALRLCIERLIPRASNDSMVIQLPEINMANGNLTSEICTKILSTLSGKEISFDQTKNLMGVLEYCKENMPASMNSPEAQKAVEIMNRLIEKHKKEY